MRWQALVLLLGANAALADEPTDRARALYAEGSTHYKVGRFQDARHAYESAYELKPLPGFLFNIAQCHFALSEYERAIFFYEGYLRDLPDAPNRALVLDLIREAGELRELVRQRRNDEAEERRIEMQHKLAVADAARVAEESKRASAEAARLQRESELAANDAARLEGERRKLEEQRRLKEVEALAQPPIEEVWLWTGAAAAIVITAIAVPSLLIAFSEPPDTLPAPDWSKLGL